MGLPRLLRLIRMEEYVKRQHPSDKNYLYLWFLAVRPSHQGQGLARQLLDPMLAMARQQGKPVLLETSTPPNIALYRHKGFEVRHEWLLDQQSHVLLRFMRKE